MHHPARRRFVRRLIAGLAYLVVLSLGRHATAEDTIDRYCREFHQECAEARAQGYRDVGICNVERLECRNAPPDDSTSGVGKGSPAPSPARPETRDDKERSVGP